MLKDYLKEHNISLYRLSKNTGIPYSTISDLAGGSIHISRCSAGNLHLIAQELHLSMDEVYSLCEDFQKTTVTCTVGRNTITGNVVQSGKCFYLHAVYRDRSFRRYLCRSTASNRKYIDFIAETGLMNILLETDRQHDYD